MKNYERDDEEEKLQFTGPEIPKLLKPRSGDPDSPLEIVKYLATTEEVQRKIKASPIVQRVISKRVSELGEEKEGGGDVDDSLASAKKAAIEKQRLADARRSTFKRTAASSLLSSPESRRPK